LYRSRKWSQAPGNIEDLDEYTALQKYISTYRDPKAAAAEDAAAKDDDKPRKKWQVSRYHSTSFIELYHVQITNDRPLQFWKKKAEVHEETGTVPNEWLTADIKQGLSNADVEARRKRFGWNEIMSEKENLFIKFLMFFTGPVLYGMWRTHFFAVLC
jgi:H+-transporting ATPase